MTAASTHFNEENFVIENHLYFKNKKQMKNSISIIVPRHIERVDQIKEEIEKFSLNVHLHSSEKKINKDVDIYIVDTYGDLNKFYKISNVVFLGGSLINHGGQNPLEPARHGCKVLHGPYVNNFKNIYNYLNKIQVSKKIESEKSLKKNIEILITNKKNTKYLIKKVKKLGDKILINAKKEIEDTIIDKAAEIVEEAVEQKMFEYDLLLDPSVMSAIQESLASTPHEGFKPVVSVSPSGNLKIDFVPL